MASTDSREVTSARIPTEPPARASAVSLAVISLTSVTTTVAPSAASFSAMPRPMPCPAPVTMAILLSSLPMVVLLLRGELAAQHLAGDDELHDLRGAVADLQAEHVAQPLLDRQLGAVAVLAVQQQALVDDVVGGLGRPPLAHRGLGGVRLVGVLEPERAVAEQPRGGEQGLGLGERERDALVRRQRPVERLAGAHVAPGLLDGLRRGAEALQADQRAAEVEALHDLGEAPAGLAEQVVGGDAHPVEVCEPAGDGLGAHVGDRFAAAPRGGRAGPGTR